MRSLPLRAALLAAVLAASGAASLPAFAMGDWPGGPGPRPPGHHHGPGHVTHVPEIDAGAGAAALAAVGAALAFAWERRRRR